MRFINSNAHIVGNRNLGSIHTNQVTRNLHVRYAKARFDSDQMSDISIKNDSSMSRRSIKIDVVQSPKGFIFKLTVLKATNPVLHNNVALSTGETVSLNFGDNIVLGKTRFRFDKDI